MSIRKQVLLYLGIVLFIGLGAALTMMYAKGYRFGFDDGKATFAHTGILVAKSNPDGAEVLIDGHLATATNNNVNLAPGEYMVRIQKEGYFPWEKKIIIEEEIVSNADALLLPIAPKLEGLTSSGVSDPVLDPSQTRIAYTVASQSAKRNGIYVLDMNARIVLNLQTASRQIASDLINPFSQAELAWSPDGQQLLAALPDHESNTYTYYLLNANQLNDTPQDVTLTLDTVLAEWKAEQNEKDQVRLSTLKKELRQVIAKNFHIIEIAPDNTKILYVASESAQLPIIIKPRLPGVNSTPEARTLEKGATYVYDIKDDRNYKININLPAPTPTPTESFFETPTPTPIQEVVKPNLPLHISYPLRWYSDSSHLINTGDKKINLMEFDGANVTTIFAGPFQASYAFPWPGGGKIVILTDLGNTSVVPNLYTIELK